MISTDWTVGLSEGIMYNTHVLYSSVSLQNKSSYNLMYFNLTDGVDKIQVFTITDVIWQSCYFIKLNNTKIFQFKLD